MTDYFEEKKGRGHGCCGFIFTLFLVLAVIAVILIFSTNLFTGYKNKILGVLYPQKYQEYVTQYAGEYGVEEALVYAVIKTESGFREEVESHAGAVGLMQLMPETFFWLQEKKDGEVTYSSEQLKDPAVNIEYGTYYLSWLLSKYGDEKAALAAYNAGVTNVDSWLSDRAYSTDGKTLSSMPFKETQQYVDRVESTKKMYEDIYYQ